MKVKIKNKTVDLHHSTRIYTIYENIVDQYAKEGIEVKPDSLTASKILIYGALVATMKYNKIEGTLTYDEMENIVDDNGGMQFIKDFASWMTGEVNSEIGLAPVSDEEENDNGEEKKS